jgi:hypothetical protein
MATKDNGFDNADALQKIIEKQQSLTTEHEDWVQRQIATWAALREGDADRLKTIVGWERGRDYIIDPLPAKISDSFADLLFGEDPTFTAAETELAEQKKSDDAKEREVEADVGSESNQADQELGAGEENDEEDSGDEEAGNDQERLEALVEANELPSELRHAETVCSSEGEVWWRIYIDEAQSDYPIIEWYSRSDVRPLFRGRRCVAVAFYNQIYSEKVEEEKYSVYRWVGIYADGHCRNLLYHGNDQQLGTRVDLNQRPETQNLRADWNHGFDMLCGRIPNRLGRDRRLGISDYQGVRPLLLALNEAATIAHENARISAKKRAVVPASAVRADGTVDLGGDVLVADDDLDDELSRGRDHSSKFAVLEYSFDAQALITYKDDIVNTILTRVGLDRQFANVGKASGDGQPASGTALKIRLIPTTLTSKGKARPWDDKLPEVLMLAQLVDKQEFGRKWQMAGELPTVERGQPLPEDETEAVNRHSTAVTADIESRRSAIHDMHPEWDDDQIDEEIQTIVSEMKLFMSVAQPPAPLAPEAPGGTIDTGGGDQELPPEEQAPPDDGSGGAA